MSAWLLRAASLLAAGIALPLAAGIIARLFLFRRDDDDVRNDPDKARVLHEHFAKVPSTPEPPPLSAEPWPDFVLSPKPDVDGSGA